MTGATVNGVVSSSTYDGDDVRVRTQVDTQTTTYLWDRESGLPLLVDDGGHGYVYAGETLVEDVTSGGTAAYPLLDPLGSVRGISDGAGALTGTRDYDGYGAVRASTGTSGVFGFTGEQTDRETGFVYLRARQYDPATGRFLSVDTVQPNAPGTQGYHVYAYAANNPTTWTDPSGRSLATMRVSPVMQLVELQFGLMAVAGWAMVGVMAELGLLDQCAVVLTCAAEMIKAERLLDVLDLPFIRTWADAWPLIKYAIYWSASMKVIMAVTACLKTGECVNESNEKKENCISWEENNPGGWYSFLDELVGRRFKIGPGRQFSPAQKRVIYSENRSRSWRDGGGYILRSDTTGEWLEPPEQSKKNEPSNYQAEVDHRCPMTRWRGSNRFSNACVISKAENSGRGDPFPPDPDYCRNPAPPKDDE